jgi:hypothetical protein
MSKRTTAEERANILELLDQNFKPGTVAKMLDVSKTTVLRLDRARKIGFRCECGETEPAKFGIGSPSRCLACRAASLRKNEYPDGYDEVIRNQELMARHWRPSECQAMQG